MEGGHRIARERERCSTKEDDVMSLRKRALVAGGLLLLATPVLAESNEPATDTGTMDGSGHHMMGRMGHGMWGEWDPKAIVEGRLAFTKTALGITDNQSAAWNSYADAARANMQSMQDARHGMR
jgi:hypothetical protein